MRDFRQICSWLAAIVMIMASERAHADATNDVLWLSWPSRKADDYSLLMQLHHGGFTWVTMESSSTQGAFLARAELQLAVRVEDDAYERLQPAFAALMKPGEELVCTYNFRVGIAPRADHVRHELSPELCSRGSELFALTTSTLLGSQERMQKTWPRLLQIVQSATRGALFPRGSGAVTLERPDHGDFVVAHREGSALPFPEQLVDALRDAFPEMERVHMSYTLEAPTVPVAIHGEPDLRVNDHRIDEPGLFEVTGAEAADRRYQRALAEGTLLLTREDEAARATLPLWVFGAQTPVSMAAPQTLFEDDAAIDVRVRVNASELRLTRKAGAADAQLCAGKTCETIELERARGLAALALGECEAGSQGAREAAGKSTQKLEIRAQIDTVRCRLTLPKHCFDERRPGLDLLTDLMRPLRHEPQSATGQEHFRTHGPTPVYTLCSELAPKPEAGVDDHGPLP